MFFVPGGNASSTKGEGGEAGKAAKAAKGATTGFQSDAAKKAADKKAKKTKADEASAKKEAKKKAKGGETDADAKDDKSRGGLDGPTDPFRGGGAGEDEDAAPPKVKKPKTAWAEFIAKDGDGNPLAGLDFELTDIEGDKHKGKTAPNGSGRVEKIPEGLVKVKFPALLTQVPGFTMELKEVPKKKASEAKPPTPKPPPPPVAETKPAPRSDLIRRGTAIRPPKKNDIIADEAAEKAWFAKLEDATPESLEPGDILIRKTYELHPVRAAQGVAGIADKGTAFTVHCMLYVGDGQVCHALGEGVVVGAINRRCSYIVYRPTNAAAAKSAVTTAKWIAPFKLPYSMKGCLETAFRNTSWGPSAKSRAAQVVKRKLPVSEVMCSGLAALCYQGSDPAYIKADAIRLMPLDLEDYLNDHPELFRFEGVLRHQGTEETIAEGPVAKAIELANKVEHAAVEVKSKVEKVGNAILDWLS